MSDDRYPVPAEETRREDVIDRSRFITVLAPSPTVAVANEVIDQVRAEFPDATHHCYAYLVGPPGTSAGVGMSDDGEPHGTAGRPMLNLLTHGGIGDVVAVVTRYFGGRKLGRGGLVRAYGGCVQSALAEARTCDRIEWIHLELSFSYANTESVRRIYAAHEVERLDDRFDAAVTDRVRLPRSREAGFRARFTDLLRGRGSIDKIEDDGS